MFLTYLWNAFEFSEYRLIESHALFGGVDDVLSAVSHLLSDVGAIRSTVRISVQSAISWKSV
jgi:hypothetical protein